MSDATNPESGSEADMAVLDDVEIPDGEASAAPGAIGYQVSLVQFIDEFGDGLLNQVKSQNPAIFDPEMHGQECIYQRRQAFMSPSSTTAPGPSSASTPSMARGHGGGAGWARTGAGWVAAVPHAVAVITADRAARRAIIARRNRPDRAACSRRG